jgi:hypothetical protein
MRVREMKGSWKDGLDLRVAGVLDKKFWQSQDLREDGDDQRIWTNAVLKSFMLVA